MTDEAPRSDPAWRRKLRAVNRVLAALHPYRSRLFRLALSSAAAVTCETIALAAVVPLATTVSAGRDEVTFDALDRSITFTTWTLVALTTGAVAFKLVFGLLNATQDARLLARYELDQRRRGFRAFLESAWEHQSAEGPGQLQHLLVSVVARSQTALRSLTAAMYAGAGLAIMLAGAFVAGGVGALAIVVAIAALVLLLSPVLGQARRHASQLLVFGKQFSKDLEESISLAREARVFRAEARLIDRLDESVVPYEHHRMKNQQLARASALLFETAGLLLVVSSLAVLYVVQPESLGDLTVMALLMARGLMYGRQLNNQLQACSDAVPFVTSLEATISDYEANRPVGGDVVISRLDEISFEDVAYQYDGRRDALRNVSARIAAGDSVGVIGPSGSGKSTFLQLLLMLRAPTTGRMLVNGSISSQIAPNTWFERVNLVPQEPRLISGTIMENIRFFRSQLDDDDCVNAAKRAHIHKEILAMPAGYATPVGPRADAVSGGQRQRICIARALAGEPELIVFDEPTSALDAHSEDAIHRSLQQLLGETTLIIVAHRLRTIGICNKLMVFRDGQLEAYGSRSEIEAQNSYYADVLHVSHLA